MHIKIAQKELENAAVAVSNLVEKTNGPVPVLSNLLIDATDNVTFRGSDLESMVHVNLDAAVVRPGRVTIPADTFKDIVKLLPPMGMVNIEQDGGRVLVSCDTNEYKLMTLPAEDFPEWPTENFQTRFQFSQRLLKELIEATTYALPQKDHRRVLLGVHFELGDNILQLTATDGKKLSRVKANIPEVEGQSTAAITVPRKLLENVAKVLGSEGPVDIQIGTRQISFRLNNMIYRGNGIEGKYPDCNAVIPRDFPTVIKLNRDTFTQAVRRAGIVVTDEKNKSIILGFDNNMCHFQSMAHDLGTFSGKMPLDYSGSMIELAFNYQFLIETLGRFHKPEVSMYIKSSTAPVVFRGEDEENRLALLMPIKLSDVRQPVGAPANDDN